MFVKMGHFASLNNIGRVFERLHEISGGGEEDNLERAKYFYRKGAEKKDILSCYNLASLYCHSIIEQDVDGSEIVRLLETSMKGGYNQASVLLAAILSEGGIVDQDIDRAIALFKQSVEKGDALSNSHLGSIYLEGIGVEKNPQMAFKHFLEASEKVEDSFTFEKLAEMYLKGNGVKKDLDKSAFYYARACKCDSEFNETLLLDVISYYQISWDTFLHPFFVKAISKKKNRIEEINEDKDQLSVDIRQQVLTLLLISKNRQHSSQIAVKFLMKGVALKIVGFLNECSLQ